MSAVTAASAATTQQNTHTTGSSGNARVAQPASTTGIAKPPYATRKNAATAAASLTSDDADSGTDEQAGSSARERASGDEHLRARG